MYFLSLFNPLSYVAESPSLSWKAKACRKNSEVCRTAENLPQRGDVIHTSQPEAEKVSDILPSSSSSSLASWCCSRCDSLEAKSTTVWSPFTDSLTFNKRKKHITQVCAYKNKQQPSGFFLKKKKNKQRKKNLFSFLRKHTTERLADGLGDVWELARWIPSEASWKIFSISGLTA